VIDPDRGIDQHGAMLRPGGWGAAP
jgi:hypothetical protein